MPKISIVVPVYNVEAYLPQCLDSIRAQSFQDFEVLCVVDGSKDRSEHIVDLFSQVDTRIKKIKKENGGLSSARNMGADHAVGDILMFVDSDDMLDKNACRTIHEAFTKRECEIVTFGGKAYPDFYSNPWLDEALSPRDYYYDSFNPDILFKENSRPYAWRTAITREFWVTSGIRFDETVSFGEDQIFHFAIYPRANHTQFLSDKLYIYRVNRKDSLMHSRESDLFKKFSDHINIVVHICIDWREGSLLPIYSSELFSWTVDFLLYDAAKLYLGKQQQDTEAILSSFWKDWFSCKEVSNSSISSQSKKLIISLMTDASAESAWIDYAKSTGLISTPSTMSLIRQKLRRFLPMSAEGLQERLENNRKQEQWHIEDNSACVKSLSLLQAELLARKFNK